MPGEIALDSTTAIRYLNGDLAVVEKILSFQAVVLPLVTVGELLFGAENSARPLENLTRYLQFIDACTWYRWDAKLLCLTHKRVAL